MKFPAKLTKSLFSSFGSTEFAHGVSLYDDFDFGSVFVRRQRCFVVGLNFAQSWKPLGMKHLPEYA